MAEMALEARDDMRALAAATVAERDRMGAALAAAGIGVRPSCTNFLLLDVGEPGEPLATRVRREGLVVRTFGDPDLVNCIRVSPATPESNDLLLRALGASPSTAAGAPGRSARVARMTTETTIDCNIDLDGTGAAAVATGIGFLDHMLTALACHSLIDLRLTCQGDLWVDLHHTVEDVAIALGQALDQALGDRAGIRRFGDARAPLDESLCHATVDLSGRGIATIDLRLVGPVIGELPAALIPHFFDTLARQSRIGIHLSGAGRDDHHLCEAAFKSLALALRAACAPDDRRQSVPSTKGTL
jgi:imidazoleglycerol-phosphate dehydratase